MKPGLLFLAAAALLIAGGCKPKPKPITSLERKEAANFASEAVFAVTLRDYARAEPLYEKAANLCPDNGDYALSLGATRRRQGDRAGAKSAYESAISAYRAATKLDPSQPAPWLEEVYVLALLGRADDARSALAEARKKAPDSREVREFSESHQLDRVMADPGFKEIAL